LARTLPSQDFSKRSDKIDMMTHEMINTLTSSLNKATVLSALCFCLMLSLLGVMYLYQKVLSKENPSSSRIKHNRFSGLKKYYKVKRNINPNFSRNIFRSEKTEQTETNLISLDEYRKNKEIK
jgi:hypothetical protein